MTHPAENLVERLIVTIRCKYNPPGPAVGLGHPLPDVVGTLLMPGDEQNAETVERSFCAQRLCLAREDDENRLADFLGAVGIADAPQRDRINEVEMPRHKGRECSFGLGCGKFPQQGKVIGFGHSPSNVRRTEKGTE